MMQGGRGGLVDKQTILDWVSRACHTEHAEACRLAAEMTPDVGYVLQKGCWIGKSPWPVPA